VGGGKNVDVSGLVTARIKVKSEKFAENQKQRNILVRQKMFAD